MERGTGFCFFLLFSLTVGLARGYDFTVGGRNGWVTSPSESYSSWSGRMRFNVNDSLVFVYDKAVDSVLEVTNADYSSCNAASPITKLSSGRDTVKLPRSGPFYFISGNASHCQAGQKLTVVVISIRSPPSSTTPSAPGGTTPASAPSPASTTPPTAAAPSPSSKTPTPAASPASTPSSAPSPTGSPTAGPALSPSPSAGPALGPSGASPQAPAPSGGSSGISPAADSPAGSSGSGSAGSTPPSPSASGASSLSGWSSLHAILFAAALAVFDGALLH